MVTAGEADADRVEFQGKQFFAPAVRWGISAGERLAVATFGGGASCFDGQAMRHSVEPDACDLSLVASGRCPLLTEHCMDLGSLLGRVEAVRHVEGHMEALVRFARGDLADKVWSLVEQNFPVSLSIGATVERAVRMPGGGYLASRWRLREISACVYGKDSSAELRLLGDADTAAWFEDKAAPAEDQHAAVRDRLRTDRWSEWAFWRAGPKLARQFGLATVEFSEALQAEAEGFAAELEGSLFA